MCIGDNEFVNEKTTIYDGIPGVPIWSNRSISRIGSKYPNPIHSGAVRAVAVLKDNWRAVWRAVSASDDKTLKLWNIDNLEVVRTLSGHSGAVQAVAVFPNRLKVISASADATLKVWDMETGRHSRSLEGHTESVQSLAFSANGRILASVSSDNKMRIWDCRTWLSAVCLVSPNASHPIGLAFHPTRQVMATVGRDGSAIQVWELSLEKLFSKSNAKRVVDVVNYANAKVVLVGDSGVGKSGLGLVLAGEPFKATESTHNRKVWVLESGQVAQDDQRHEIRETILWDLAGQPGYRIIHQLHLNEVVVALLVFDARSEIDPFAGIRHWDRALRQRSVPRVTGQYP